MYTIASLSDQGWVSDPKTILSYCMSSYMLTDAAQTLTFEGNIKSLPAAYYLHINDPSAMASAMMTDLTSILSNYFAQVEVNAQAKRITDKHYAIVLQASAITEDGERVDLAKMMEIDTQNLRKIIEFNNYGEAMAMLSSIQST